MDFVISEVLRNDSIKKKKKDWLKSGRFKEFLKTMDQ